MQFLKTTLHSAFEPTLPIVKKTDDVNDKTERKTNNTKIQVVRIRIQKHCKTDNILNEMKKFYKQINVLPDMASLEINKAVSITRPLPVEMLFLIFRKLIHNLTNWIHLKKTRQVCQLWKEVTENPRIWKKVRLQVTRTNLSVSLPSWSTVWKTSGRLRRSA